MVRGSEDKHRHWMCRELIVKGDRALARGCMGMNKTRRQSSGTPQRYLVYVSLKEDIYLWLCSRGDVASYSM